MEGIHITAVDCQLEKAAGNCYKGNVVNVEQSTVLDAHARNVEIHNSSGGA
jgi:hypothetical protein